MFKIYRIFSDDNGDSHIEELTVQLNDAGTIGRLSAKVPATGVIFREVEASYDYDYHTAPERQYVVMLDGELEIETSLHDKRVLKAGDILLAEDTTGKGHRSRNLKAAKRKSLFITLPENPFRESD